jgi:hypothetical protein
MSTVVTIEVSRPGDAYDLFRSGAEFDVHLAAPSEGRFGGTGPCLCGFNRFAEDVGFSVGGGFSGPGYTHHPCAVCAELIGDRTVTGTHKALFVSAVNA